MRPLLLVLLAFPVIYGAQPPAPDPHALTQRAKEIVLEPQGRTEAEALLRQAIALFEKEPKPSEDHAEALTLLAMILHPALLADKDALSTKVEPLARRAIEIRESIPETKSADLALDLELEAMILEELGRIDESRDPKAKARALRDQIILAMQTPDDLVAIEHMGSPGLIPPRLVARPEPQPPFEARVLKISADLVVEIIIGGDGGVHHIEVFKPAGFGLDEAGVEALLKWRFLPAQKNGVAVPVEAMLRLRVMTAGAPPPQPSQ